MSIQFNYNCPRCNRPTNLSEGISCPNILNDGRTCGWVFPSAFQDFNSKTRGKIAKHTTEPSGQFSGKIVSYNSNTGFYLDNISDARRDGNVFLDPDKGYFLTYITPSGDATIATLCSGDASTQFGVSGFAMPVNSSAQNLHGHYSNQDERWLFVATPEGVQIEEPNTHHPDLYHVYQSGNLIAAWDRVASTGFAGKHIIV